MKSDGVGVVVGGEPSVPRVYGVRADKDVAGRDGAEYRGNYHCVIEPTARVHKLNDIPAPELRKRRFLGVNSRSAVGEQEFAQKIHTRPRGSAVVGINIVPPVLLREVHHIAARVHALRDKIGAVSADILKVVEARISRERPVQGVAHRRAAVVADLDKHSVISFVHYMRKEFFCELVRGTKKSPLYMRAPRLYK